MHPPRRSRITDVVVFAGGDAVDASALALRNAVPPTAWVIAADSGLMVAETLGVTTDLAVGDFDSVDADLLARHVQRGGQVERHPVDKDQTDLAIALDHALSLAPTRITLIGGAGGRLDHLAANLAQIARSDLDGIVIDAYLPPATVHVVATERTLNGDVGELVTLLAMNGDATGVSTSGLEFALTNETLTASSSRGVSNRFATSQATITVSAGRLIVIRPGVD